MCVSAWGNPNEPPRVWHFKKNEKKGHQLFELTFQARKKFDFDSVLVFGAYQLMMETHSDCSKASAASPGSKECVAPAFAIICILVYQWQTFTNGLDTLDGQI